MRYHGRVMFSDIDSVQAALVGQGYYADRALATTAFLSGKLGKPLATLITRALFPLVKNDVSQDFAIWKNKRYVERPSLAVGDGPIAQYRKWAAQFYEGESASGPRG